MKATNNWSQKVKSQFQNAVNLKHSCKIYVTTKENSSWSFYFRQGYLIWASSNVHRFRRLHRLTNKICPEINCLEINLREQEISELWEYLLVSVLYKRKQISLVQTQQIIEEIIKEVLFDCLIAGGAISQVKVIFETKGNSMGAILRSPLFKNPITKVDYRKIIGRLELDVADWQAIAPDNCSPNFAPIIKNINKLRKAVAPAQYRQLFTFIDGNKTVKELAIASGQNTIEVMRTLAPQIESKAIFMQQVRDRQLAHLYFTSSNSNYSASNNGQTREHIRELDLPLIIYVDDNPHICQQVAKILNPMGYRIIPVSDAAKTLIVLLDNKPDLIILNAVMPDANGYELCAQIRKMPDFKTTPIAIAREQEKTIDFIKAKMAGASDFISKPIQSAELLTLAQKHTQNASSS